MTETIEKNKSSRLQSLLRLFQILGVLARHKVLGALFGKRPGLAPIIATDIAALTTLVALGEKLMPSLRAFDLPRVVSEFDSSLKREIDFNREARSVMRLRAALADFHDLWIPDVMTALSSGVVLTMEFSAGAMRVPPPRPISNWHRPGQTSTAWA